MRSKLINKKTMPYILIGPTIIYYLVFWLKPVIGSLILSLKAPNGSFTLANYAQIFNDLTFMPSLWNTAIIATVSVTVEFIIALLLAIFIAKKTKGSNIILLLALIPMALPPALVGIMWRTGFDYYGWINSVLVNLHLVTTQHPVNWLGGYDWNLVILIIILDAWTVIPSVMIILLAGLQNMPKEMSEAGYTFGASKTTVLRKVVVPILKPTIITAIILRLIAAIQIWMVIVMLVGFGRVPVLLTQVVYYANQVTNLPNSQALAAAYSVVVTLIVAITAIIYLKASGAIGKKKGGL